MNMKKQYNIPTTESVKLNTLSIICTSTGYGGGGGGTEQYPFWGD